jgi:hypothetical protein
MPTLPPRGIRRPATLVALLCLAAPAAANAQSGGAPVPGPDDPCPASYPGDDAGRKQLAQWMARGAAVRDLPEQLPVMAGLAESGLRNLHTRGNPFSGFFSMHRALDTGPYRGFRRDPELQLRWFTDTAIAVRQRKIAEGEDEFGADPSGYGLWVADVERPARSNRDGYQPYLDDAEALIGGSCLPSDHAPDRTPPALRVKGSGHQRGAVVLAVRCPGEPCVAAAEADPSRKVRRARAVEVGREPVTLTLAARARRTTRLVVTVTAVDQSGNATRRRKRVTLLR